MMSVAKPSVGFLREVDSIVVLKLIARAMHGLFLQHKTGRYHTNLPLMS